ncbi:MAG: hypothetical protein AAFS13_07415 [Pseudomonadota bacterium]
MKEFVLNASELKVWIRSVLAFLTLGLVAGAIPTYSQSSQGSVTGQIRELLPYDGLQGTGKSTASCQIERSDLPWVALGWSSADAVPVSDFSLYDPKPSPQHYRLLDFLNTRLSGVLECASRVSSDLQTRYRGKSNTTADKVYIHGFGAGSFLTVGKGGLDIELAFRQIREQGFCISTPRKSCRNEIHSYALQYARFIGGAGTGEEWAKQLVEAFGEPVSFTETEGTSSASYDGRQAYGQYHEARRDATWWLPGRTITLYWGLESGEGRLTVWHQDSLSRS